MISQRSTAEESDVAANEPMGEDIHALKAAWWSQQSMSHLQKDPQKKVISDESKPQAKNIALSKALMMQVTQTTALLFK